MSLAVVLVFPHPEAFPHPMEGTDGGGLGAGFRTTHIGSRTYSRARASFIAVPSPSFSASSSRIGSFRWHNSTYAGLSHSGILFFTARTILSTGSKGKSLISLIARLRTLSILNRVEMDRRCLHSPLDLDMSSCTLFTIHVTLVLQIGSEVSRLTCRRSIRRELQTLPVERQAKERDSLPFQMNIREKLQTRGPDNVDGLGTRSISYIIMNSHTKLESRINTPH